mmetsp:Transcript_36551/g.91940  ORF Transcript_36551/g.91940 Transcript_36551/m.91940 type:complete len:80 (+) Transcript_36551:288-527(+)
MSHSRFLSILLLLSLKTLSTALPVSPAGEAGGRGPLTAAAEDDLITSLPGIPEGVAFRQFSGYIPVHSGRSLFYWFVGW